MWLTLPLLAAAQARPGSDDSPILTLREAQLLDSIFAARELQYEHPGLAPGTAALAGKRYAFVTGSSGHVLEPKSVFFHRHIFPWLTDKRLPAVKWVPFTEAESRASGGYDGVMLVWVKLFLPKRRNALIRQLNEGATTRLH